ncbi:hypothetical protein IQR32_06065 [Acinetobacter albensis]|uniref:BRO-N domain-containing protein n=1 Tax=Acinetobacter TaxID=469 RepID=UPI0006B0308E|nr:MULTISPECIES: BRO family protein [Acinetobacter]ALD03190.1 hypothetical protein AMQ28_13095 [Acinetobacter sp. TTH0-4]MBE9400919.1 hypothetical protein [Acinetobacter albensis]
MKISIFIFDGHDIRIALNDEGEPIFCLADVCSVLEIRNANPSRFNLVVDGVYVLLSATNGGTQELNFITEENLHRILLRSRKPKSRSFQDWAAKEALPAIRKIGGAA